LISTKYSPLKLLDQMNRNAIDASYQVSIYLAKWFQRRRFLEIDQSETRMAYGGYGFFNRSGQNEQSL
jgi:hypothetical protein